MEEKNKIIISYIELNYHGKMNIDRGMIRKNVQFLFS